MCCVSCVVCGVCVWCSPCVMCVVFIVRVVFIVYMGCVCAIGRCVFVGFTCVCVGGLSLTQHPLPFHLSSPAPRQLMHTHPEP